LAKNRDALAAGSALTLNASQSELLAITARNPKSIYANTTQELPTKFNRCSFPGEK
jgi:hypothetical protein